MLHELEKGFSGPKIHSARALTMIANSKHFRSKFVLHTAKLRQASTSLFCSSLLLNKGTSQNWLTFAECSSIKLPIFIKQDLYDSFSAIVAPHGFYTTMFIKRCVRSILNWLHPLKSCTFDKGKF